MTWISKVDTYLSESEQLNNAQLTVNHFKGTDWSKESLSALCGNMSHESTFNPNLYEMGYGHDPSRGYGLVQWTPATKLWNWCDSMGLNWSDGDSQLARIDYEVANNIQWIADGHRKRYGRESKYDISFAEFRSNAFGYTIEQLTEAFMWNYEGPSYTAGTGSLSKRQAFALKCANQLDWEGTGGGTGICFIYPTDTTRVTSGFLPPDRPDHFGIDFAESGTHEIYATADGVVSNSYVSTSYGEVVFILHTINGQQFETVSAHMQTGSRRVSTGDSVTQGQVIGIMGSTGDSTGQHLHFELHQGRWNQEKSNAIDPMLWLGKGGCGGGGGGSNKTGMNENLIKMFLAHTLRGWG